MALGTVGHSYVSQAQFRDALGKVYPPASVQQAGLWLWAPGKQGKAGSKDLALGFLGV